MSFQNQFSDSDTTVQQILRDGFRIITHDAAKVAYMPSNRDDVVSGYVRMRIREWRDSGRELQGLAKEAGTAKSTPSQVLLGTGIGAKTGPRFARAFGFSSYDAMKLAAFDWWKGRATEVSQDTPPAMMEAIQAVIGLGQGTEAQVATILAAYNHPRFRGRDRDWWIQALLAELARDRQAVRDDKATRESVLDAQRQVRDGLRQKRAGTARQPTAHGTKKKSA